MPQLYECRGHVKLRTLSEAVNSMKNFNSVCILFIGSPARTTPKALCYEGDSEAYHSNSGYFSDETKMSRNGLESNNTFYYCMPKIRHYYLIISITFQS